MDALEPRSEGLMRSRAHSLVWIAVAVMISAAGCKVGNPLNRTVKVTQEPSLDPLDAPSPRTRLASSSVDRNYESAGTNPNAENPPHEAENARNLAVKTAVARKAPSSEAPPASKSKLAPNDSVVRKASAESFVDTPSKKLPKEHAELLEAFRDSPPEVQQQALRQLLAVSGQDAVKSQSPASIADALRSSMTQLPILPEDVPEATELPHRLASGEAPKSNESEIVNASLKTDDESENGKVQLANGAFESTVEKSSLPSMNEAPGDSLERENPPKPLADSSITTASEKELYAELAKRLKEPTAGESDADRYRRQIIGRNLMLFSGDPDAAVVAFDGMTETEQEFLRHYLLGVWSMVDTSGHPVAARRWSAALPEMRMATQKLSGASETLEIKSLAFCSEIQSFGQVTKFDTNRFDAGQKVILYCEIDNFLAQSTPEGFETHLQGSYEVFDAKGQKVAGQVLPADKQVCDNYLRDYFIAYQMNLPSGLEPGEYRLELTMECLKGQKYGQSSLTLQIAKSPGN